MKVDGTPRSFSPAQFSPTMTLKILFSVTTAQSHLFKDSFYDQINSVAMGSPCSNFYEASRKYDRKIFRTPRYYVTIIYFVYFIRKIKRYCFSTMFALETLTSIHYGKRSRSQYTFLRSSYQQWLSFSCY